jgi:hypothetical protein
VSAGASLAGEVAEGKVNMQHMAAFAQAALLR